MARRPSLLLVSLSLASLACADRPATAVVAAVAADSVVLGQIRHVRISAQRGGAEKWAETYEPTRFASPGTVLFHDTSNGEDKAPLRVLIEGFDGEPRPGVAPKIQRSARLTFVPEKTKLLRMGLARECLGVSCDPGSTCYRGACQSEVIEDPSALEDAPGGTGPVAAPDISSFDDIDEGGGGAGGEAGAGGSQGGEAGSGGDGGSALCAQPLKVTLGMETPDGNPLGSLVVGQSLVLRAKVQGIPGGAFRYTYRVFSRSDAAGTTLASGTLESELSTLANRCLDVRYEVTAKDDGCPVREATAQVLVPSVVASGPHVNQETCTGQLPPEQQEECGSTERPWCGLAGALASVDKDALLWKGPSGRTVVKLASGAKSYPGPLVMVDGIDIDGGWNGDFSGKSGVPTKIEGAALPLAGEPGRCLVRWPQNGDAVRATLSDVHLAVSLPPPGSDLEEVAAAVCIGSRSGNDATLTRVKIDGTAGDHGIYFEGVYVHDSGQAQVLIEQADIVTPVLEKKGAGSPKANNAVKVDGPSSAEVEIRGGSFRSGGFSGGGELAGGLLWLGDGRLTIRKDGPGERARFFGGPTKGEQSYGIFLQGPALLDLVGLYAQGDLSSPDNERSVGLWLEGTPPVEAILKEVELVGGAVSFSDYNQEIFSPMSAGLFRGNKDEVASVLLRDSQARSGGSGAVRAGLFALNLTGVLENVQGVGADTEGSGFCLATAGAYFRSTLAGGPPEVTVKGGSFLGGSSCANRTGMYLDRMILQVEQGTSPTFLGTKSKAGTCSVAHGLAAIHPQSVLSLAGGIFQGGTSCDERKGIWVEDVLLMASDMIAEGSTAEGAARGMGLHLRGTPANNGASSIISSKLVGGIAQGGANNPDDHGATGLFLDTMQEVLVSGNDILGCPPVSAGSAACSGALRAVGLLVERPGGANAPGKVTVSGGTILGGPVQEGASAESIGVAIRSKSGGSPSANVEIKDVVKIEGNADPNLAPRKATGLLSRLGQVTLHSSDLTGPRQQISGGFAKGSGSEAVGVELCGDTSLAGGCKDILLRGNVLQGSPGAVDRAVGLVASHGQSISVDACFLQAGGLSGSKVTEGISLGWIPQGLFTNNFIFGGAGMEDRGCSFTPETFSQMGALYFFHNFCYGLGVENGTSHGLLANVIPPGNGQSATYALHHNLVGTRGTVNALRIPVELNSTNMGQANVLPMYHTVLVPSSPVWPTGGILGMINGIKHTEDNSLFVPGLLESGHRMQQPFAQILPGQISAEPWKPTAEQCNFLVSNSPFEILPEAKFDYFGEPRTHGNSGPTGCPKP